MKDEFIGQAERLLDAPATGTQLGVATALLSRRADEQTQRRGARTWRTVIAKGG